MVGNLTWNANGTLAQLAITDPFDSANNQTCSYTYDDLVRLSSANCGSIMSQTFSFDPFGNVTANGTWSFQPAYSPGGTNHIAQIGSSNVTYDGNGNVTNDGILETYSWDADGHAITINGSGYALTYDALGQMVEMNLNGTYSDEMYSPTGFLMQYVNSQKKFVPLPGGDQVVYVPGAPGGYGYYYRHADWLGSTRLASTTSRTMYYDLAYTPYGAPYAVSGSADYVFTGVEHTFPEDYDFPAREYSIQGRWPSPDPAGMAAASPSDPQTWNRYAYVRNSPLEHTDPVGMMMKQAGNGGGGGGMLGIYIGPEAGDTVSWDPVTGYVGDEITPVSAASLAGTYALPGGLFATVGFSNFETNPDSGNYDGFAQETISWSISVTGGSVTPTGVPGGGGGVPGTWGPQETPAEAATKYCRDHGQLSFKIPFTKTPMTISLSTTFGPANYSATNDFNVVVPVIPWPEWLAAGASVDVTINAPNEPTSNPTVGLGKNLGVGYFTGPTGPQGVSLNLGPSIGPPVNVSVPAANVCGKMAGGL